MQFFERNGDALVSESLLRGAVFDRYEECATRQQAVLWIEGAIRRKKIVEIHRPGGGKMCHLCLPHNESMVLRESSYPPEDMETVKEEMHVVNLLQKAKEGWLNQEAVLASLANNFQSMGTHIKGGHVVHVVALTEERANLAVDQHEQSNGIQSLTTDLKVI